MVNPDDVNKKDVLMAIKKYPDLGDIMNSTIETIINPKRLGGFTFHKPDADFLDFFPDVIDSTIGMMAGTVNTLLTRYNLKPFESEIRWRKAELADDTIVIIVGKNPDVINNMAQGNWEKNEKRIRETGEISGYPLCCIDSFVKDFYSVTKKERNVFGDNATSVVAFFRYFNQTKKLKLPYLEMDKDDMLSYHVFLPSIVFVHHGIATNRDELFNMQHVPCKPYCPATLKLSVQYLFWKDQVNRVINDYLSGENKWSNFNPEII